MSLKTSPELFYATTIFLFSKKSYFLSILNRSSFSLQENSKPLISSDTVKASKKENLTKYASHTIKQIFSNPAALV